MNSRPLSEVLADLADAGRRYPELNPEIVISVFEHGSLRAGVYRLETVAADRCVDGKRLTELSMKLWPTEWLLQFARAVSQGVMPEAPLPGADGGVDEGGSDEGHGFSRSREDLEATVEARAFSRIPQLLNPE